MKNVVLIGDSIRMGYQDSVKRELSDVAEVWGSEENGENSRNVLRHLDEWAVSRKPDLIHINCGLHDLKRDLHATQCAVPIEEYRKNVRQILEILRSQTGAIVIWASTTPVNELWHREVKMFDRLSADVDFYNAAAAAVTTELKSHTNNLFAAGTQVIRDGFLTKDGVHFTPEGYDRLGKAVAQRIRPMLVGS